MANLLHHPASGGQPTVPEDAEARAPVLRPMEDLGARASIAARLFGEHATPVMIARFRITRRIGAGGMGRVYEAVDAELDRRVAIKLLAERDTDRGASRQRMLREARSLARVSHPNVVQIFDVGEHEGAIFLAMEYVDGQTLEAWQEQPRRWRAVLDKYLQAGEGLAAVHANGLVHRDFKPANVLVDGNGRVKVADFGVAILEASAATTLPDRPSDLEPSRSVTARLTETGAMLGTPAYMSPEQLRAGMVDARTDQFSFCFALYEAVFGRQPYSVEQRRDRDNRVELGHLRAPGWLRGVLVRGLAPRPADRWPDMDELLRALRRGAHRGRTATLTGAALVGATAIASASFWAASPSCEDSRAAIEPVWNAERGEAIRDAFVKTGMPFASTSADTVVAQLELRASAWDEARVEVCRDHRLRSVRSAEFHDASMACLDRQLVELGNVIERLTAVDAGDVAHARDAVATLPPIAACLEHEQLREVARHVESPEAGTVRDLVLEARLELALGHGASAIAAAEVATERARALDAQRVWAEAEVVRARALDSMDRWDDAEAAYFEAVRLAEATRHDDVVVEAWAGLFAVDHARGDVRAAGHWLTLLQGAVTRIGDPPKARASHSVAEGQLAVLRGDYPAGERSFRAALQLYADAGEPEAPEALVATRKLANVLADQRRFDAAEELYQRVIEVTRERWGEDHPDVAHLEFALGYLAVDRQDFPRAIVHLQRAIGMFERAFGPSAPRLSGPLCLLADCFLELRDFDAARATARRAVEIQSRFPPTHVERASGLGGLANIEMLAGNRREAIALYERTLAVGLDTPLQRARAEHNIAKLFCDIGECLSAIPHLERASADAGDDAEMLADLALVRARVERAQRDER